MLKYCFRPMLIIACLLFWENPAFALRCSGNVIDAGTPKPEVLAHCGEPTWVDERQEKRFVRGCPRGFPGDAFEWKDREYYRRGSRSYGPYDACVIYVTIEEWFYNFGSSRFTQTLIFEDNRLVDIIEGGYGYLTD